MPYIRTKNFIHDSKDVVVVNENGTLVVLRGIDKDFVERTRGKTWNTGTNVVLAQKNTIEELCDELIIKNPNNDGDFYRKVFVYQGAWKNILNEKHAKHCTNRDIYEHDVEIFGAIWVFDSDGAPTLKPVAKMNENGKLELL